MKRNLLLKGLTLALVLSINTNIFANDIKIDTMEEIKIDEYNDNISNETMKITEDEETIISHTTEQVYLDRVTFPDDDLRTALATILNVSEGDDISHLTSTIQELNLSGSNIKIIKGLEIFTELTRLDLSGNNIGSSSTNSLKPLSNLTNLEYLNLSGNKIRDIEGLANLTNLIHLDLSNNNRDPWSLFTNALENLTEFRFK